MAEVMSKADFCSCLDTLKKYTAWENTLYDNGIDLCGTPVAELAEKLQAAMCGFNSDWSYDSKLDFDWILEWSFDNIPRTQKRHGKLWLIDTPEDLYEFLVFMNANGWEA
jgi:hypothetical protein